MREEYSYHYLMELGWKCVVLSMANTSYLEIRNRSNRDKALGMSALQLHKIKALL